MFLELYHPSFILNLKFNEEAFEYLPHPLWSLSKSSGFGNTLCYMVRGMKFGTQLSLDGRHPRLDNLGGPM